MKKLTLLIVVLIAISGIAVAWDISPMYNPFEVVWGAINDLYNKTTSLQQELPEAQKDPKYKMFIHIEGIDGESKDDEHEGWIDVQSYDHSVTQPVSDISGGRTTSKSEHSDFSIVKELDKSSPKLALRVCDGQHIPSVVLELVNPDDTRMKYMVYELRDVIISSVSPIGDPDSGARPLEELTLNYAEIGWTYTEYEGNWTSPGKGAGDVSAGWNVETNSGG